MQQWSPTRILPEGLQLDDGREIAADVIVQATGYGFMDYTLERKRYTIRQSVAFIHQHRGLTLGIGLVANLGMLLPFLGWLLVPTYATVAATIEIMEITEVQGRHGTAVQ